jgi:hypothetical protein
MDKINNYLSIKNKYSYKILFYKKIKLFIIYINKFNYIKLKYIHNNILFINKLI